MQDMIYVIYNNIYDIVHVICILMYYITALHIIYRSCIIDNNHDLHQHKAPYTTHIHPPAPLAVTNNAPVVRRPAPGESGAARSAAGAGGHLASARLNIPANLHVN